MCDGKRKGRERRWNKHFGGIAPSRKLETLLWEMHQSVKSDGRGRELQKGKTLGKDHAKPAKCTNAGSSGSREGKSAARDSARKTRLGK